MDSPDNSRSRFYFFFIALISLGAFWMALAFQRDAHAQRQDGGAATVLAAGDIGNCKKTAVKQAVNWWFGEERYFGGHKTAKLLDRQPGTVLALGDLVYRFDRRLDVTKCFVPSWGRFRDRTAPVPGNHDFDEGTGQVGGWGYYDYWGPKAGARGRGYYSFQRGPWHIAALNSELDPAGLAAQEAWLRRDLAATEAKCILAFWHRPVFSSGHHGDSDTMAGAYRILFEAGASVLLTAHDHNYERLAQLGPNGRPDPERGIRNFVVGTGGHKLRRRNHIPRPGSEVFNNATWGVLKLVLLDGHYRWQFLPVDGQKFTDRGRGRCVDRGRSRNGWRNVRFQETDGDVFE